MSRVVMNSAPKVEYTTEAMAAATETVRHTGGCIEVYAASSAGYYQPVAASETLERAIGHATLRALGTNRATEVRVWFPANGCHSVTVWQSALVLDK